MTTKTVNQIQVEEFPDTQQRDGSSQASRFLAALDPNYVSVDERSVKDMLDFARKYAKELRYFEADNDQVQANGDWRDFISDELDLDEVLEFIQHPETFSAEKAQAYTRPHFVLFLTFLQLHLQAQAQLNTFTQRHLDFYYQQVLGVTKKPEVPDQVHVLLELAPNTEPTLVPAGTLLEAGTNSLGQELFYSTDNDIVVNNAKIAQLSSVYVEKWIIGPREARENYQGSKEQAILQMLQVALGDPRPGDALPLYATTGQTVDYDYLCQLQQLVNFVWTALFMDFPDFRILMKLKDQRDNDDAEWEEINRLLEKAGQNRTNDPNFQLNPTDPQDFDTNLATAMGSPPNFDRLFEVDNIDELYEQRTRKDVQIFIRCQLYFEDVDDFYRMMQIKTRIDNEWQEINRLLQKAARTKRRDTLYTLPLTEPPDFNANLEAALGPLTYPSLSSGETISNFDTYYTYFLDAEHYFFTTAENVAYLMAVATTWVNAKLGKREPAPEQWDKVYCILAEAHKNKVYAVRRATLHKIHCQQSFEAMLDFAVGHKQRQSSLDSLQILTEYIEKQEDIAFLEQMSQKVSEKREATEPEWEETYRIVALGQRALLAEPIAQVEKWFNLYPAEQATSIGAASGEADPPRWKTFGQRPPETSLSLEYPPPTTFGWAISSPILALSEGKRIITLTLVFQSDEFDATKISPLFPDDPNQWPFRIEISTETGWIETDSVKVAVAVVGCAPGIEQAQALTTGVSEIEAETISAIQFQLTFAAEVDAFVPLSVAERQLDSPWPVLRLLLRPVWHGNKDDGKYITHYQAFKELVLVRTYIDVNVSGLTPLQLQNDETQLDPNKPFEPFGSQPAVGARFYIGHPELTTKQLNWLNFNFEWMGVPDDIETGYYNNYPGFDYPDCTTHSEPFIAAKLTTKFTTKISLVDKSVDTQLNEKANLFADLKTPGAPNFHTISIPDIISCEPCIEVITDTDLLNWNRYWQWELNSPDFQHQVYPAVAASKSLELAVAISNGEEIIAAADYQVNPPYTPKIKHLSLSYTASVEVILADDHPTEQIDKIFHVHPFGVQEMTAPGQRFLPQYDYEGELYIGLQALSPPQNLTLLFQMAEGSADPDVTPVPVQWHYLTGNRWRSLEEQGQILQDTTRGLINSGLLSFSLAPSEPNTLLSSDLYWIRAAIPQYSNSVCDTIAIHTQAVSATFTAQHNALTQVSCPLPADSITDLAEPLPQITGVHQPYTSFGGKNPEQENAFYQRLSERLRHKQRALTIWDYEHLILERFPQIYKAKCLPATPDKRGQVEIIVIPDLKNQYPFNPYEPKASSDLIAEIETYIINMVPSFVTVNVRNAHYVAVKVRFAVCLLPGYDAGYYILQLNDALNHFLSPWAYEEGADIVIGGRIYANVIVNFIEEQPYVDYMTGITLFRSQEGTTFELVPHPSATDSEGYWVEAGQPDEVLVTAGQHEIILLPNT